MTQEKKSPITWSETKYTDADAAGLAFATDINLLFSIVDCDFGYGACYRAFVEMVEDTVTIDEIGEYAGTSGLEIDCEHTDLDQAKQDCEVWLETFVRSLYNQL